MSGFLDVNHCISGHVCDTWHIYLEIHKILTLHKSFALVQYKAKTSRAFHPLTERERSQNVLAIWYVFRDTNNMELKQARFEMRTATGSELFSLLTCLHTTTFTLPSTFSPLEMISIKIWETPLSWHAKRSLSVAVRISKTRMLKLPINEVSGAN